MILLIPLACCVVVVGSFVWGWHVGIKETEQRWSAAVRRKHDLDEFDARTRPVS